MQLDPVEQANNMHNHNQELKFRFGLSSERAVTEGKLLQISKGKSEPYNKELEGHNLQPELYLQKRWYIEAYAKSIDLMPESLIGYKLLVRTQSEFDQYRKLLQMLDGVLK